nr:VOC family protein [Streptomyces sp. b94]
MRSSRRRHFRGSRSRYSAGRLLGLGARHVDVGRTGDESWVTLADPEGNEFCVLASRRP